MVSLRSSLALASILVIGLLPAVPVRAAVGAGDGLTLAAPGTPTLATRRVEGTVSRLTSSVVGGYPVTEVTLESGESFRILGGESDGVLWVAEEEPSFRLGDRVSLELELGALGWRPRISPDAETLRPWERGLSSPVGAIPRVHGIQPARAPAVADAEVLVEIEGENFGTRLGRGESGAVLFQGLFEHVPAEIVSWSDTRIVCRMPRPGILNVPQIFTGAVKVWHAGGGFSDGTEWSGPRIVVPFQYAGDHYKDERLPIPVLFNPAGFPWSAETVSGVIERSAAAWNAVDFSYGRFEFLGEGEGVGERRRDGENTISWTSPWPHAATWLAVTWSALDLATGERLETDVEVNSEQPWSVSDAPTSGYYDLRSVLTHELGHWFRLGHVSDPHSVMNSFISQSDAVWQLSPGDREGAVWIYPTYGHVVSPWDRTPAGSSEVRLDVQAVDRSGVPRAGVSAEEVIAVLEWQDLGFRGEPEGWRPGGRSYIASRDLDAEGRTEIVVPAPRQAGVARFRVFVEGVELREAPIVVFEADAQTSSPEISLLGSQPVTGSALRARVRLAAPVARLGLRLYDARGRLVLERDAGSVPSGVSEVTLDLGQAATTLRNGVYFLEMTAGAERRIAKVVLLSSVGG